MYNLAMELIEAFKALSNKKRLKILHWLKNPEANFPPQPIGDFKEDGVCVTIIQEKAGLSQSTISQYLAIMEHAGLVRSKRLGQWTYYSRNERGIARLASLVKEKV